jgi:hypothetical protein
MILKCFSIFELFDGRLDRNSFKKSGHGFGEEHEVMPKVFRRENPAKKGKYISDGQINCNSERQRFPSNFQGDMGCRASDGI